ncbi:MAG: dockerin type I repeat-containing protein [Planctomycetota bacterium]|jgi:hypothetical protein
MGSPVPWLLLLVISLALPIPTARAGEIDAPFLRGDANLDGALNLVDAIFMLDYVFGGGAAPECLDAVDANDDGILDLSDPVFLLEYLFGGGNPLPLPFPILGLDPTPDLFGCPLLDCLEAGELLGLAEEAIAPSGAFPIVLAGGSLTHLVPVGEFGSSSMSWTRSAITLSGTVYSITGSATISTPISGTYFAGVTPVAFSCTVETAVSWTYLAGLATTAILPGSITIDATPSGFVSIPAGSAELPPGCINATTTATAIRGEIETTVNASNGPETFLRNHLDGVLDTIFDGQGILICDP